MVHFTYVGLVYFMALYHRACSIEVLVLIAKLMQLSVAYIWDQHGAVRLWHKLGSSKHRLLL